MNFLKLNASSIHEFYFPEILVIKLLEGSLNFKILRTIVFNHWCQITMPKMSLKGGIVEKGLEGDTVKCILHSRNMGIFILLSACLYVSDIL